MTKIAGIIKYILIVIASAFVCMGLMLTVYSIPTENIRNNVIDSAPIFEKEGAGPKIWYFYSTARDNNTDALMLLEASNQVEDTVVQKALLNYFEEDKSTNSCWTLVRLLEEEYSTENSSYGRYWHGYLLWLKPVLCFMPYGWIRIINLIIQLLMSGLIICALYRLGYKILSIGYLNCMLILWPLSSGFCMQYSSCFYMFSFGTLAVIGISKKDYNESIILNLFLLLGIFTAFFDFLTYPITTLFIPAVIANVLISQKDIKIQVIRLVKMAITWCVGYVGMWSMKWILASIFTDNNIIKDAIDSVMFRTASTSTPVLMGIILNIGAFVINPFTVLGLIAGIAIFIRKKMRLTKYSVIYIVIALTPLLWYCFAANHSYNHFWFAFRNMIIPVLSMYAYIETQSGREVRD